MVHPETEAMFSDNFVGAEAHQGDCETHYECEPTFFLGAEPYPEPEVTRGVTLADHYSDDCRFATGPHCSAFDGYPHKVGCFDGDDDDDLTCCAGVLDLDVGLEGPGNRIEFCHARPRAVGGNAAVARPAAVFEAGDMPMRLSSKPFVPLEPTTVDVQTAEPFKLGNAVQNFFYDCYGVAPAKVNRSKFALKAEISHDFVSCTAKLRVHEVAPGNFIVEVQRRSGDSVLFVSIFRRLTCYLAANGFTAAPCN